MQVEIMWKALWRKWTIDKPAAFGDWLWDVFVVQLAALLNRLTLRQIVVFIPVVVLFLAYYHSVPIPPALMLLGDLLAYIDIFSVLLLIGILSRATTVLFIVKQMSARLGKSASSLITDARRLNFWREHSTKGRKRLTGRSRNDDDEPVIVSGLAWA
jgi:hypothetical protein